MSRIERNEYTLCNMMHAIVQPQIPLKRRNFMHSYYFLTDKLISSRKERIQHISIVNSRTVLR